MASPMENNKGYRDLSEDIGLTKELIDPEINSG